MNAIKELQLQKKDKAEDKLNNIVTMFKSKFYKQIAQSLFDKHKPLFGLLLIKRISQAEKTFNEELYEFITKGVIKDVDVIENPIPSIISYEKWKQISYLSIITQTQLLESFKIEEHSWKEFIKTCKPMPFLNNDLLELALCKVLCPNNMLMKIQQIAERIAGYDLLKPNAELDLSVTIAQSNAKQPIILIPSDINILKAKSNKIELVSVSFERTQRNLARKQIQKLRKSGGWVIVQNCHLYPNWMAEIEEIVEETAKLQLYGKDGLSPNYRLWLASISSECFTSSLLHKSYKCVTSNTKNINEYKDNLHCILLERSKYKQLAWNDNCYFYDEILSKCVMENKSFSRVILDWYCDNVSDERDERCVRVVVEKFLKGEHKLLRTTSTNKCVEFVSQVISLYYNSYLPKINTLVLSMQKMD